MIDDRFLELKGYSLLPNNSRLASELAREALQADDLYQLNEESVKILERELADVIRRSE